MYTFSLTVRRVRDSTRIIAESSEPGQRVAIRKESPFELDTAQLNPFPLDHEDRKRYGEELGKAIFQGPVAEGFQRAQARADQSAEPLHILLSVEDQELRSLRWEWLCAPLNGVWDFLRLQQRLPFSLHLPSTVDTRFPAISRLDLRALVVVANLGDNPYGLQAFDPGETVESIRRSLGEVPSCILACDGDKMLPGADGLPTVDEICRQMTAEHYPILHIVCHGKYVDEGSDLTGECLLFLRKSDGGVGSGRPGDFIDAVTSAELIQRLSRLHSARGLPHLSFIAACETADVRAAQALGGLGHRFVQDLGMPAVIAMTEPVSISTAERLAGEFYKQLRKHGAVDRALDEACAGLAERDDILVPALFSRLGGQKLFDELGPLTPAEKRQGLSLLSGLLEERAPVLLEEYRQRRRRLEPLVDTDPLSLSPEVRSETENDWSEVERVCREVVEIGFDALAKGETPPTYDARCPFPGLAPFDKTEKEDFTEFFFGRDELVKDIRRQVEEDHFLAVLGPSGSGKSSLTRAGLLKSLARDDPEFRPLVFLPGTQPLERLRDGLRANPHPSIIVVDQFEELFAMSVPDDSSGTVSSPVESRHQREPAARQKCQEFLDELLPLREQTPLVLTMRADFLGDCTPFDELYRLLEVEKRTKLIRPLDAEELREVMELQANAVGLRFEPGLSSQILNDVEGEPGAMPLLQHCLRQLWLYRHGRWLRLAEYVNEDRVGAVKGAIARTADHVFMNDVDLQTRKTRPRSEPEKQLIRYIFERLTRIDTDASEPEQRRDTRQRATMAELTPDGWDPELTRKVVNQLASAKLVITSTRGTSQAAGRDHDGQTG